MSQNHLNFLWRILISCLNFLLDYQYQDLNTSNKPVKLARPVTELSDKFILKTFYKI